jgi:hypothetical protein
MHRLCFQENNGTSTRGGRKREMFFSAIGFSGRTDFAVVRYSIISSGLHNSSLLRFPYNAVKTSFIYILESNRNIFVHTSLFTCFLFVFSFHFNVCFNWTRHVCKWPFSGQKTASTKTWYTVQLLILPRGFWPGGRTGNLTAVRAK